MTFRDTDYSPARGVSMWESCPQLAAMDPATAFVQFDDFFHYKAQSSDDNGWTATLTGGASAATIADAVGGVLAMTCDAADNDSVELQWNAECFKLATSKPLWFETRLKISDATESDIMVGLFITDSTVIDGGTDGVYFRKADGDANILFVTEKNSSETSTDTTIDIVAATYVKLGFFWDGSASVFAYVDGTLRATHTANICDDEELAVTLTVQNGEAVAKVLSVDYVKCVQVR